jgi:hypothetical protein
VETGSETTRRCNKMVGPQSSKVRHGVYAQRVPGGRIPQDIVHTRRPGSPRVPLEVVKSGLGERAEFRCLGPALLPDCRSEQKQQTEDRQWADHQGRDDCDRREPRIEGVVAGKNRDQGGDRHGRLQHEHGSVRVLKAEPIHRV